MKQCFSHTVLLQINHNTVLNTARYWTTVLEMCAAEGTDNTEEHE